MAINLPYMVSSGTLTKILNKICDASIPENFNGDFLGTKLGFPGGNQKTFIPWAKKCKLLGEDGTPTQLYKDFRNPKYRGVSMASALKKGYEELYVRNEYAHDLSRPDFLKLVTDTTGLAHDNSTVKAIVSSFFNAKEFADFESTLSNEEKSNQIESRTESNSNEKGSDTIHKNVTKKHIDLGINYTINLVLPKTDDPAIYNAIFKSLKENLLNE
ncbi:DUF5343 domain-containing protein [Sphingobacterium oryzagri]|uniref:DUF5343 domain-containing protein n=1 Tax=Sphingobacterium oryzagri TaxID=3025669 RepID=A0ABY7WQ59_9SPHI|nr:DUF5343 domain-containing protein [Sphingobacterium sp. KACC 22765]WDF70573.1 DUF5343 domain-containing protein [Sphingobacterium sp. KACC 22765]